MPRATLENGRHQFSCYIDQDMKNTMQKLVDAKCYESMSEIARVAIKEFIQSRHNIDVSATLTPNGYLVK